MHPRNEILDWAQQGRIASRDVRKALEMAGALPSAAQWRQFLDRLPTVLVAKPGPHARGGGASLRDRGCTRGPLAQ